MTVQHSARFSPSMVPNNPEEARAFLQERTALLGKFGCLISVATLVLVSAAMLVSGLTPAELVRRPEMALNVVMVIEMAAIWLACSKRLSRRLSLPILIAIDAGASTTTIAFGALSMYFVRETPGAWVLPILSFAQIIFVRTVVIPSTARRTLLISAAAMLPTLVVIYLIASSTVLSPKYPPAGFVMMASIWCGAAVAAATLCSRVIYGLRERAGEAIALGQYTLVEKIGEGGMGVVYRAKHTFLRRPTAVKLLSTDKAGPHDLLRFEREVQLTSQLSHPNTIAIYDYGHTPEGVFYYAMEYLDGLTLQDLVDKHGPLPASRVIHILSQVTGALREAHSGGLIHRDIKPANIVLCERGGVADTVKVLDFGLVKDIRPGEDAGVTLDDAAVGTPFYLAPEGLRGADTIDGRLDLYALGAVGYFLLTGKVVFEGKTLMEICGHHLHSQPTPPSKRVDRPIPDDIERVILRCLAKDPTDRPPSAANLQGALSDCLDAGAWSERDAQLWWESHGQLRPKPRPRSSETALAETLPAMHVNVRERGIGPS